MWRNRQKIPEVDRLQTYKINGLWLGALCLSPSLSKRRTSPFLPLCRFIFMPTCLGSYEFQGSVFSQALWGKLSFPAGSELPSTTGSETAELGAEMQILSFFCASPQNGLTSPRATQGWGSHQIRAVLSPWYHIHSSNNFSGVGDSSALFSSLKPFFFLSFSP